MTRNRSAIFEKAGSKLFDQAASWLALLQDRSEPSERSGASQRHACSAPTLTATLPVLPSQTHNTPLMPALGKTRDRPMGMRDLSAVPSLCPGQLTSEGARIKQGPPPRTKDVASK